MNCKIDYKYCKLEKYFKFRLFKVVKKSVSRMLSMIEYVL